MGFAFDFKSDSLIEAGSSSGNRGTQRTRPELGYMFFSTFLFLFHVKCLIDLQFLSSGAASEDQEEIDKVARYEGEKVFSDTQFIVWKSVLFVLWWRNMTQQCFARWIRDQHLYN